MSLYIKYKTLFALYIEFTVQFALTPFFRIKTCKGETIIDIPYGQIIFTPGNKLRSEQGRPPCEEKQDQSAAYDARISENRS